MVTNHLIGMQYDLISGCRDSSIALWRNKREKFEQVETLEKHGPRVCIYVLCFSPCGQCFASGSDDGAIKIWEIIPSKWNRDGELRCIQTISRNENGHNHEISALTFSTCGNFLASADWNGVIKVWQKRVQGESKKKQKWRCIQMLNELADRRNEAIFSLCFSRCGNYLFSGSRDTTIKAWTKKDDMFTCTQVLDRHNNGHSLPVCALSFSPRYNYLVSGGKKVGAIKLWRMSESAEKHNRQMVHLQTTNRAQNGHCGDVRSFCFSPCGRYLASGSTDNTVKLWLLRNDKLIFLQQLGQEVDQHTAPIFSLCFSSCGKYLASGALDKTIKIWVKKGERMASVQTLKRSQNSDDPLLNKLYFVKKKENKGKKERLEFLRSKQGMLASIKLWKKTQ